MYHAELGRFITRDPLPQNGQPDLLYDNNEFGRWLDLMKNLYGYVDGNPTNLTDPSGLIKVYIAEAEGAPWYESQTAATKTIPEIDITYEIIKCGCEDTYKIQFGIEFSFNIIINTLSERSSKYGIIGAYGHEQRHVLSYISKVRQIEKELLEVEYSHECDPDYSEAELRRLAAFERAYAIDAFNKFALRESRHGVGRSPRDRESGKIKTSGNPLSPINGKDYDPIGIMPSGPANR